MDPRHIVIPIPCLARGGTEMQTLQLVRVLAGAGTYDITVVCYFEFDEGVVAEFEASGAKVCLLKLSRSLSLAKLVRRLRAEFRSLNPHVVHVQYMAPGLLPIIAARLAGCGKIVATVHQPWTSANHKWQARWLLRFGARLCTRFICVSEAAERSWFGSSNLFIPEARNNGRGRHCTIHNAVDIERIDRVLHRVNREELRSKLGLGPEPVIGIVSRLSREKGIDIVLEAMALLVRQLPKARLLIVGDGAERPALEAQARSLGLSQAALPIDHHLQQVGRAVPSAPAQLSTILWAGRRRWEQSIELMAAMDIVVVPSRFEGFGLSAAEAMACGKPVVVAALDGLLEVIGLDGAGVPFKAGDPGDLAAKVLPLTRNVLRGANMGSIGRERVKSHFSVDQFRARSLGLYQDIHSN